MSLFRFLRHPKQTVTQVVIAKAATKVLAPLQENTTVKNWQTTAAGIATILSVLAKIMSNDWKVGAEDVGMITGGIGLIVAKDKAVTGVGDNARREG